MAAPSSGSGDWQDRRGMFQKGKQVHAPASPGAKAPFSLNSDGSVRRSSVSSTGGDKSPTDTFPTSGQRRRSSAASGGLFGNLTNMKRGSQDYGERRASHSEMMSGGGGMVSGWFNQTFKGIQKPTENQNKGTSK